MQHSNNKKGNNDFLFEFLKAIEILGVSKVLDTTINHLKQVQSEYLCTEELAVNIIKMVCHEYKVNKEHFLNNAEYLSKQIKKDISSTITYLLMTHLNYTQNRVGKLIHNKDRSTISRYNKRCCDMNPKNKFDFEFLEKIKNCEKKITEYLKLNTIKDGNEGK